MKGLAWYSAAVYSLFILTYLALAVLRLLPPNIQPQGLLKSIAPFVYVVLTVLSIVSAVSFIRSKKYDGKRRAIFCLGWAVIVVLLPIILGVAGSFYSNALVFILMSGGYEWAFIGIAALFMLLFIPVVVFWIIYLVRLGKVVAGTASVA